MSQSYVGEVRLVGFNYAPYGWAFCNGNVQSISENPTLFNLIGTTYGGDGQTTYQLPNLQGRIPIHQGSSGASNYVIGQNGGAEAVTIIQGTYPAHSHSIYGTNNLGGSNSAAGNVAAGLGNAYSTETPANAMNAAALAMSAGSSQPHNNLQPYQVLNWVISLYGVYPTP
jgi:microcystin-dependent protein